MTASDFTEPAHVTVIGLGDMGAALADSFLTAGHNTTVWNRTPSKADDLVSLGAIRAASVRDAVDASELLVVCVTDYDAVTATLGLVEDFAGKTVLNVTSGSASGARAMGAWMTARNGVYLDGAILAMTSEMGSDKAGTVFCSGPRSAWDQHEFTLRALGSGIQWLGADAGLTGLYDVAALGVTWGVLNSFLHAAALFEAVGEDPRSMLPLVQTTLQNVSGWLPGYVDQIEAGVFPPDGDIRAQLSAIENLLGESKAAGINTDLPELFKSLGSRAVSDGDGAHGYPALINQFRKPSRLSS